VRRADIVIIGAGITGSFLAERLTRAGRSVVVIDRRKPQSGSTAASTCDAAVGARCFGCLSSRIGSGLQRPPISAGRCRHAVGIIGDLAGRLKIDKRLPASRFDLSWPAMNWMQRILARGAPLAQAYGAGGRLSSTRGDLSRIGFKGGSWPCTTPDRPRRTRLALGRAA